MILPMMSRGSSTTAHRTTPFSNSACLGVGSCGRENSLDSLMLDYLDSKIVRVNDAKSVWRVWHHFLKHFWREPEADS